MNFPFNLMCSLLYILYVVNQVARSLFLFSSSFSCRCKRCHHFEGSKIFCSRNLQNCMLNYWVPNPVSTYSPETHIFFRILPTIFGYVPRDSVTKKVLTRRAVCETRMYYEEQI